MKTETKFSVPDIVCGGCANSIKKALGNIEGIGNVEVDIETKIVNVEHEPEIGNEKILEILDDIGFPAQAI